MRDSIFIDSKPITPDVYDQVRGEVGRPNQELGAHVPKFEVLASTAITIFEMLKLGVVVMEVGMVGGWTHQHKTR